MEMGKLTRPIRETLEKSITATLKQLLSTKHLYQNQEVDLEPVLRTSKELGDFLANSRNYSAAEPLQKMTLDRLKKDPEIGVIASWAPDVKYGIGQFRDLLMFELPSINTYCDRCKHSPPFNPMPDLCSAALSPSSPITQWYMLAYQCQQCKTEIVQFLVRRDGLKLRLTGRDPIEAVPAPTFLPKDQRKYFSDSIIAHQSGQTLAGIFLLRVFIEQYWRTLPEVQELLKQDSRATGERQGDTYQDRLPADFKSRFPSLKAIYGDLSEAIHTANADTDVFDSCCVAVERHFDARRLYKL